MNSSVPSDQYDETPLSDAQSEGHLKESCEPPSQEETRSRIPKKRARQASASVDWDQLAFSDWGQTPLTACLDYQKTDNLVGWATHVIDYKIHKSPPSRLIGLSNAPPPPAFISLLHEIASKQLGECNGNLWECFDHSALVAVGVILEEMVTASVLPLAERHVKECRDFDEDIDSQQSFGKWTLPPEEAFMQIYPQVEPFEEYIRAPSSSLPTRTIHTPAPPCTDETELSAKEANARKVWRQQIIDGIKKLQK